MGCDCPRSIDLHIHSTASDGTWTPQEVYAEGRRIGEARPEWEVYFDLARRAHPDLAERLTFESTQAVREEIARVVGYDDIPERLPRAALAMTPRPSRRPA